MKYIILDADYLSTGIKDQDGNQLSKDSISLPSKIWDQIELWVSDYSCIVQMEEKERKMNIQLITKLDRRGIELCSIILSHYFGEIKIEYFSEGLLKKIPIC